jgi:hypothetical protein
VETRRNTRPGIAQVLRSKIANLLGPRTSGALEYFLRPELRKAWGGPFNGQSLREASVREILGKLSITAVVETGTFRGTTTEWFAANQSGPVYTFEKDLRFHRYSQLRLRNRGNVRVILGDSQEGIQALHRGSPFPQDARVFYYLDAHWGLQVPLEAELESIFASVPGAVVMIDDFRVPDDPGYAFDTYEGFGELAISQIIGLLERHHLAVFFPAGRSQSETGKKRGAVVLAPVGETATLLERCGSLRRFRPIDAPPMESGFPNQH